MIDQLREALDKYDEGNNTIWYNPPWVHKLAEAASLVADPDTLTVWWCGQHGASGNELRCFSSYVSPTSGCRMIQRVLLAPALDALLEGQSK